MNSVSNDIINLIREKTNIVDIVSEYIPLTPKGKNYFGVCPFHNDNHPSMSVSKEKQIYKCFSCSATGNVFTFVSEYENINFIEAVKMLADKVNIELNINSSFTKKEKNQELYKMDELSNKFYQNNINSKLGIEAKKYLNDREIADEIIKEFEIGLALKDNKLLSKLLVNKSFKDKDLENSGLIIKQNYSYTDLYYNRIMFPLWDLSGKAIGFSGRVYNESNDSKYINTRETEIFKKGEMVYNYHKAKNEARKLNKVIVMEGFMDVIRAHTIGIKNVVAVMGTAVTKEQVSIIKRMAKEIVLCFDGDEAGEKATILCTDELQKQGINPKIIRLENNLDPDEYIKINGKEAFEKQIENAMQVMDYKLKYFKKDKNLSSTEETATYLNRIIKELSLIDDDILKELTLNKLSEEIKIDINVLKNKLNTIEEKKDKAVTIKKISLKQNNKKNNKFEKAEKYLLYYILISKKALKLYIEEKVYLFTGKYRLLANEVVHYYRETSKVELADIMTVVSEDINLKETLNEIMQLELKEKCTIEEIKDYIKTIRQYNVNIEINRLMNQMKKEVDAIKKASISLKIIKLKKEERNYD